MFSPSEIFIVRENIQALCPFTKIWVCAKVIGFISSLSVKIKFSNWQGKFSEHVFDILEKTEQAKWCIRKVNQSAIQICVEPPARNSSWSGTLKVQ